MKAATIRAYGGPEVFAIEEVPDPEVGPRDVLVEVRAAGINPVDAKMRRGVQRAIAPKRMPAVLGLDVSGVVVAVGAKVSRFGVGDEVFGSPTHRRQGTYAELVSVNERELALKPARLSHLQAASIPLVAQTAWQSLVTRARLGAGESVFIQAGSGGVGTFAIQLAKHLGAEVTTTTSARNLSLVKRLGADRTIDYRRERYDELLCEMDVALECLGGSHLPRARRILRRGGRLVYIATGLPDHVARYGAWAGAAVTALGIVGFGMSSRLRHRRASVVVRRPDGEQLKTIAALIDGGVIEPVVERAYPLEDVAAAHRALETGRTRGKIVLEVRG
ncbi:MAG: NADP-dependent oxidoreductase [Polyangiaceae bacterium]